MPPEENMAWSTGKLFFRTKDGKFTQIDGIKEYPPEEIIAPGSKPKYSFNPLDMSDFTITGTVRLTHKGEILAARLAKRRKKIMRMYTNYLQRRVRTIKRQEEKERRRRLKEAHDA